MTSPLPTAFRFRKLAPGAAKLQTAFHRHLRGQSFPVDGAQWRVDALGAADANTVVGATVQGTLGGSEFSLWLNAPDWQAAVASVLDIPADAVATLPEVLQRAGLECFADGVLAAVQRGTGLPLVITRLAAGAQKPLTSACPFRCVSPDGMAVTGSWVVADGADGGAWLETVLSALAALPPPPASLPESLPLRAVVSIGRWTMPQGALRYLAVGDVALSPVGAEWTVTAGDRFRFAADVSGGILRVEGRTMTTEQHIPETGDGTMVSVDDAEVEIQARVGCLTVTLGELRRLGAGQVVEFPTPVDSPAVLTVNGRAVARGELVDVGGRVGVRITSMTE